MKQFIVFFKTFCVACIILFVVSCSRNASDVIEKLVIRPPFQNAVIASDSLMVSPIASSEVKTQRGSIFKIPGGAFVYKDGTVVKDSVCISIKEFCTTADILMSGIPMVCDSGGKAYNFESAGMFEIKGNCRGREVFLGSGKSIDVDFVSMTDGGYNFYYFNEKSGTWETRAIAKSGNAIDNTKNEEVVSSDSQTNKFQIISLNKPHKLDKNRSIIDFDINIENFPEINMYSGLVWQYSGNKKYADPDKNKWIFKTEWKDIKLVEGKEQDEYLLFLTSNQTKFSTAVYPVLSEKNFKKAMAEFNKKNEGFKDQLIQMQKESNRLATETALLRSFTISQMGIYNCDKLMKDPDIIAASAHFNFDNYTVSDINKISLFFITDDGRSIVKIPYNGQNNFWFNPARKNKLIAVLPEDKIAYFGSEDFRQMDIDKIKNTGTLDITLKVYNTKIASSGDLNQFLQDI
jgi:hypothetical protein